MKKLREKATMGTKQSELKETQATVLAERSDQSENATEQMVKHVNKCLVSKFKEEEGNQFATSVSSWILQALGSVSR